MYYSTLRGLGNAAERYGRAGWLRLYNRLESGDSVYAADVTLDFTSYLMRTYGIRSTAFRRAREILSLRAKGMVPTPGNPIRLSMGNLVARPEPVVEAGLDVPTFIDTALAETSPWAKYGLLALGGLVFYYSLRKQTRPRRRRRRPVRRRR